MFLWPQIDLKRADCEVILPLFAYRCADYYIGIPGANVMYKAGETGTDLPLTADLSVCSVTIGLTAWHGTNKILDPGPNDIVVVSGKASYHPMNRRPYSHY